MSQFIEMFGNPFENNSEMVPLSLLCSINPSKPKGLDDSLSVSFIPMDRISEGGEYTEFETKPLKDVKKGFTFCAEDDVLFAKITPCMENGKGAILKGLSNGIGFGSTEFHVLRPIPGITNSEWLYFLTKLSGFRLDAAKNMTGTGGQKRVPSSYLLNFKVMRPQLVAQKEFAEIVRQADKSKFGDFKSQFIEMFGNLPIDGTIADVVERNIKSVKKNFSPEDIIEYIDISSVDSSSHTIVETSQHVVSHAPSRAQQCVESGDILVSTVRPINRNIAVVKSELSNLVASTGFCVLRPKDGFREYILSIVQSDPYTEQMCDKASGGLYPAVNNGDVLSFGIHIPDESQLKKVTYIYRQADKSKFELRKSIDAIDKVIRSLING